jgi:hypothetical protein
MPSDTLVLKIEEVENDNGFMVDTRLFIFYDANDDGCFHVRGERTYNRKVEYQPYSFRCSSLDTLVDFIRFVLCKNNRWDFTLYNYDDLLWYSDHITYEQLAWKQCISKEIAGYDQIKYTRKELKRILNLVMNVYNNHH